MLLKNKLDKVKTFLDNNNVLASLEERYCYSKDASNIVKGKIPDLVVFVETIEDVQKIVKYAYEHEIPIVPRGAGTNMVGACACASGGIVLNFSKMNKILEINPENMVAKVQPGVVLGELKSLVEKVGLFYPPDPSNYRVSTVGGSIAQSSGGALAFKYGTTKDYVLSLKVVTANGELITFGAETSKDSAGYHLAQLMVGSEGTLGIIVEAVLKLIPRPEKKSLFLAYFNEVSVLTSVVNKIFVSNLFPSAIDFMDNNSLKTVENYSKIGLKTGYNYALFVELDGSVSSIEEQIERMKNIFGNKVECCEIVTEEARLDEIWNARRVSFSATTQLAPDVVSDDIIVPRQNIERMILACHDICNKYALSLCLVGHIGDGNLHPQIALDLENELEYQKYIQAKSEIYQYALSLGGSISAEHGIGIEKILYLENTIDKKSLEYMKMIKKVFDPKNILNPGKIFRI